MCVCVRFDVDSRKVGFWFSWMDCMAFSKSGNEHFENLRSDHFQKYTWYHTPNNISFAYSMGHLKGISNLSTTFIIDPFSSLEPSSIFFQWSTVRTMRKLAKLVFKVHGGPRMPPVQWTTVESAVATCDGMCRCSCLFTFSMHLDMTGNNASLWKNLHIHIIYQCCHVIKACRVYMSGWYQRFSSADASVHLSLDHL